MPKYLAVLPFVYRPYRDEFMETCKLEVFEVDNTVNNIGIMRAHNQGIFEMRKQNADWLIVVSAAIRFGERGGLDFIEALDNRHDHDVVEAAGVNGWHLIAFHKRLLDKVGLWDENLSPYSYCDIDISLRIQKAKKIEGKYPLWEKADGIDVKDAGMAHGIKMAGVKASAHPRIEYMKRKWGSHPDHHEEPKFDHPFNDKTKPVSWWPEPEHPLSIHSVEYASGKWKYDE